MVEGLHKGGREIEARITLTSRVKKKIWKIQGGPKVSMQYIVYSILYTYFWPTLYLVVTIKLWVENNKNLGRKSKANFHPRTSCEGQDWEQMYSSTLSLTSMLDGKWVVNTTSRPLYPRERPGIFFIGDWVGPIAGRDRCRKSLPPPGFDPRTVQPVASRCTD